MRADAHAGLVLSGGGARAAYQVGVVSLLAERAPQLRFPIITGVSAGAINAGLLAGHRGSLSDAAEELRRCWYGLSIGEIMEARIPSALIGTLRLLWKAVTGRKGGGFRSVVETNPLRNFLAHRVPFDGIEQNIQAGRLRALALSATCYDTGETVTFVQGAPEIRMWSRSKRRSVMADIGVDHLMASAAIPIVFPAVQLGDTFYGDGSVRQAAPLAPAIHLGATKIMTIAMRYAGRDRQYIDETLAYPPPGQIMGLLLNAVFLDALDADIERLERVNDLIETLPPDADVPEHLRRIDLLTIRPSMDIAALASHYAPHLPFLLDVLSRALGLTESGTAHFISYLLFEQPFIQRLVEVGYEDARRQWPEIERFLEL